MAWIYADRVLDTSVTAGTGALVVSGTAPLSWRTFSTVCAVSDVFYYTIVDPVSGAWESGEGTYSAANTITRTTFRASSTGALVSFAANAKNVFLDVIGYYFGNVSVTGGPYLALTGGTLSGALAGTSATFSSTLAVTGVSTFNAAINQTAGNYTNTGGGIVIDRTGDAADAIMNFRSDVGTFGNYIYFQATNPAVLNRWLFGMNATAESGSDAGSNFFMRKHSDAGANTGDCMLIERSTGNFTIGASSLPTDRMTVVVASNPLVSAPLGITIHDTVASSAWVINQFNSGISFSTADTSGIGAGVRLRFGSAMAATTGSQSNFVWEALQTLGGPMVRLATLDYGGNFALTAALTATTGTFSGALTGTTFNATTAATAYNIAGSVALARGSYTNVYDAKGIASLVLGYAGDAQNYYRQTAHRFQSADGVTELLAMSASAATFYVPLTGTAATLTGALTGTTATFTSNAATVLATNSTLDGVPFISQTNTSTGASSGVSFRQSAGGRYVDRTVSYTNQYLFETGTNVATRYSDFDLHWWRNNAGTAQARMVANVFYMHSPDSSNQTIVYADNTHGFIRPTKAASNLYLGAAGSSIVGVTPGSFIPTSDAGPTLGTGTARWNTVYAATGTINTSSAEDKLYIGDPSDAECRAAARIKAMGVKRFKFRDAVDAKGERARWHVGYVAEDVRDALMAEGLDPWAYGMLCADEVDGKVRLGLRYDELQAFLSSAVQ